MQDLRITFPIKDREAFNKANQFVTALLSECGKSCDLQLGSACFSGVTINAMDCEASGSQLDKDGIFPKMFSILVKTAA